MRKYISRSKSILTKLVISTTFAKAVAHSKYAGFLFHSKYDYRPRESQMTSTIRKKKIHTMHIYILYMKIDTIIMQHYLLFMHADIYDALHVLTY